MAKKTPTYWRNKADKEVSKYYRGQPCAICGTTHQTCGHHIVHRSVAYYRHHPLNLIPLCPSHHKFSNEIAPHSKNILAAQAFLDWLRENKPDHIKCLDEHKRHLGEKVDYESAYHEWKQLNQE